MAIVVMQFVFHKFVWNKHGCHSSTYIIWTSMLYALFKHECHMLVCMFKHGCCMSICVVYTRKLCTQLSCLNNAWHSCLNNTNSWNNRFCTNLEWTHEAYKFVMPCTLTHVCLYFSITIFVGTETFRSPLKVNISCGFGKPSTRVF